MGGGGAVGHGLVVHGLLLLLRAYAVAAVAPPTIREKTASPLHVVESLKGRTQARADTCKGNNKSKSSSMTTMMTTSTTATTTTTTTP